MPGVSRAPSTATAAKPTPPAAPAPGGVAQVATGGRGDDVGPMAQCRIEDGRLCGVCALLRSVDGRRAAGTEERVVHVARDGEFDPGCPLPQSGEVEGGELCESRTPVFDFGACRIEQVSTEGAQQSRAAVGARAAADAEYHLSAARRDRRGDHLARAAAGRGHRREGPIGKPDQPRDVRQFDHGQVVAPGVRRVDRFSDRSGGGHRYGGEPRGQRGGGGGRGPRGGLGGGYKPQTAEKPK